jgi:hypothetical protein
MRYIDIHPLTLKQTIKDFGLRFTYWKLRDYDLSRYEALRLILLSI